jgi:hypothetical protein
VKSPFRLTAIFVIVMLLSGCGGKGKIVRDQPTLMLAQAQFIQKTDENGKTVPVPGDAKLILLYAADGKWETEILEDPESNVFHKALYFEPQVSPPGILTIGANAAALKIWRLVGGRWQATTLWQTTFGGKENRLRDFEIADVTGDGSPDLVIATHDQGVVAVVEQKEGEFEVHELCREPETFVHEIEVGDVDGDGVIEIFATPSAPNKLDGSIQPGKILMFEYDGEDFRECVVEEFPTRHVKEVLCYDLEGDGQPVLFAALEGEELGGEKPGAGKTKIKMYRFSKEKISGEDIVELPGGLCRFLTGGDVDGDGKPEILASTYKNGIWMLKYRDGEWGKKLIDAQSSGFEHATLIADLDHDGLEEIYVAADDQKAVRKYHFDGTSFQREEILKLEGSYITFNITPGPPAKVEGGS